MNRTKPTSRQYQAQQRNIVNGVCAYAQSHGKPAKGHECCADCLTKRRELNRKNKNSKPYGVTGMGRPPLGTPKHLANASKIKKLEQSRDKHIARIEVARSKFEKKKTQHQEWIDEIQARLDKIMGKPLVERVTSKTKSWFNTCLGPINGAIFP